MSKSMFAFGTLYTVVAILGGIYNLSGCTKQPVQPLAKPVVEHIEVPLSQEIPAGMEKALEFKIQPDGKVMPEETLVPIKKPADGTAGVQETLVDMKIMMSSEEKKAIAQKLQDTEIELVKIVTRLNEVLKKMDSANENPSDALDAVFLSQLEDMLNDQRQSQESLKQTMNKLHDAERDILSTEQVHQKAQKEHARVLKILDSARKALEKARTEHGLPPSK